ncbi:MAG: hypothetical protein H7Y86_13070 [Rhizobacter sp.]|nr:hypothetical protein [Ferruginibacter sp.]
MKSIINLPGFINESALTGYSYYFKSPKRSLYYSGLKQPVVFSAAEQEGEVIEVYGCNAGDIQLGEGANTVCINPDTFWNNGAYDFGDPRPPGGGGGGGGYDEGGGTINMDKACGTAATKCYPPGTHISRCAVLRCEKNYCDRPGVDCTADEESRAGAAETEYEAAICELAPCGKRPASYGWTGGFLRSLFN